MPLFLGEDKISKVIVSVESADGGVNTNDATLNSGTQMLSGVTAYSNGKKYTGTIATVNGPSPSISVSNDGVITASVSNPKGYQSSATTKTTTSQLNTKEATTITPSNSRQTAVSSGVYTTGDIVVSAVPTETKTITANGTYTPSNGKYFSSVSVSVVGDTFDTQEKTVTPTEYEQVIGPDAGYDGLSNVTVGAISSTYVGSGVTRKSAATITPSESVQTIAANQYLTGVQTISAIPSDYVGSDVTRKSAATITPTESEQVISSGQYLEGTQTISAIPSNYIGSGVTTKGTATITPSTSIQTAVSAGTYVTGDIKVSAMTSGELNVPTINASGLVTASVKTSGYLDTSKTSTLQLTTKNAATIIPSTTDQTIDAGQYLSGIQTIQGDVNLIPENIASGVSIFGVTGTHKSSSGIDTSDATATNDKILKGYTAYINNQKITGTLEYLPRTNSQGHDIVGINYNSDSVTIGSDCVISDYTVQNPMAFLKDSHIIMKTPLTNFGDAAESDVISGKTFTSKSGLKKSGTLVVQNYYTGSTVPESSLGNDGDLYFKV